MPKTRPEVQATRNTEAHDLGLRLARARESAGMSQLDAARRLGVPQSAIAKLELGLRQLRFVEGVRLAEIYGVPLADLAPTADSQNS